MSGGTRSNVLIFSTVSHSLLHNLALECAYGVRRLIFVNNQVWLGHRDGSIRVVDAQILSVEATLNAHRDAIKSMCAALHRYVISASDACKDGGVVVWNANASTC